MNSKLRIAGWWPIVCITLCLVSVSCKSGQQKKAEQEAPLRDWVFVVNVANDPQKLKEYLDYHKQVWPEVEAGFRKAGYKRIRLFHFEHLVVMVVTAPADADLAAMGKVAEAHDPRCAAWNRLMGGYQVGVDGTSPGQTWVEAKPFYQFSNP